MENVIKKPRHIYAIIPLFFPSVGGMETAVFNGYKYLVKFGWHVHIITQHFDPSTPREEKIQGLNIHRIKPMQFGYLPWKLGIPFFEEGLVVLNDFRVNPALLICIISYFLKLLGRKKYKLIFSSHGGISQQKERLPQAIKFKLLYFLEHTVGPFFLSRTADGIQAVSVAEKATLLKLNFNDRLIQVINNGIEPEAFVSEIDNWASDEIKTIIQRTEPYILQVCRVSRVKNIETVILAMPKISQEVSLVVAGGTEVDPDYFFGLQNLVKKLDLKKRVSFLGNVTGYDKYFLMKKAKAFIQMSHTEGFPIAVMEAMSQGCVCVVSEGTGMTELVEDGKNGFCLPATNFEAVAEKVNYILDERNIEHIMNMKKNSVKKTRAKTWESVAMQIQNFYLKVLGEEPYV